MTYQGFNNNLKLSESGWHTIPIFVLKLVAILVHNRPFHYKGIQSMFEG